MDASISLKIGDPVCKDGKKIIRIDSEYSGKKPIRVYKSQNKLVLYPGDKERRADIIFGSSGSGKSYFAYHSIIKPYKQKYKDRPVYLISPKDDDPLFKEGNGIIQLCIDDDNFVDEDKIDLDELGDAETGEGSLVLFDDIESIADTKLKKGVYDLMNNILIRGRSMNISICVIVHIALGGASTKILLNESKTFTFFPGRSPTKTIKYVLEEYGGMEKKQVEKILSIRGTRAITYNKTWPSWIMTDNSLTLI